MSLATETLVPERLAVLARAAAEGGRRVTREPTAMDDVCVEVFGPLADDRRKAVTAELLKLTPKRAAQREQTPAAGLGVTTDSAAGALMKQRASLELTVKTIEEAKQAVEKQLAKEKADHREAVEALSLQQRKLKELQGERTTLLADIGKLESRLRLQVNETEQANVKLQKLQASRRTVGDQATELAEEITKLKAENDRLHAELAATLKQRDREVATADQAVSQAEHAKADTAFQRLWRRMRADIPEVFTETIVPNEKTFEQLCDAFVEFLRASAVIELHVHHLLRDLRQVSDPTDKLNHFYIMFTKNPGLLDALKDFLVSGRRKGNFANLLRAHHVWARAFASGPYKVIVRSPVTIAEELSYKSWPLKTGFTKTEDAAIGEYFKQIAQKTVPEKCGTAFRKQAADMSYEDYNDLMKRK